MILLDKYNARDISNTVYEAITDAQNKAKALSEIANMTREEIKATAEQLKNKEIEQLKEHQKLVYGSFDYPQEMERWKAFCKEHEKCRLQYKIDGGKMPYIIPYGTGLGCCYTAVCQACGEKEDITYTEGW